MEEDIDDYKGNGLTLKGPPFGLEKIYDYECGGHHPIHLGDRLGKMADITSSTNSEMADSPTSGFVGIWYVRHLITLI
jgi:hypothetical protein